MNAIISASDKAIPPFLDIPWRHVTNTDISLPDVSLAFPPEPREFDLQVLCSRQSNWSCFVFRWRKFWSRRPEASLFYRDSWLADETKQTPCRWHLTYRVGPSPAVLIFRRPRTNKRPMAKLQSTCWTYSILHGWVSVQLTDTASVRAVGNVAPGSCQHYLYQRHLYHRHLHHRHLYHRTDGRCRHARFCITSTVSTWRQLWLSVSSHSF